MEDTDSLSYEIRMPLTQTWTVKFLNCTLYIGEQVLFCWVVMILPFTSPSAPAHFFFRDDRSTRIALVFVRSGKKNDLTKTRVNPGRNVVSDKKRVLVLSER